MSVNNLRKGFQWAMVWATPPEGLIFLFIDKGRPGDLTPKRQFLAAPEVRLLSEGIATV